MAAEAPIGLVLRRGPSRQVCTILWHRNNDRFEIGQWLKARIDVHKTDISPDGCHMIYFAADYKRSSTETKGTYTAVSRVPWLKALALYGLGDSWAGGGIFTSNRTYSVNDAGWAQHFILRESSEINRDFTVRDRLVTPYRTRLVRDGWKQTDKIYEKDLPCGWTLRKFAYYPRERHALVRRETAEIREFSWEWADVDRDSLVWAENGCLFRTRMKQSGIGYKKLLKDFNSMVFEPRIAPY